MRIVPCAEQDAGLNRNERRRTKKPARKKVRKGCFVLARLFTKLLCISLGKGQGIYTKDRRQTGQTALRMARPVAPLTSHLAGERTRSGFTGSRPFEDFAGRSWIADAVDDFE